ncbi:MAG: hypothetical protein AAGU75_10600 [Bacillota bacterium]
MKARKKDVTLYNVLFPIWFLILFPVAWIVVLPANFVIDSIVLLISIKLLKLTNIKETYKSTILKVWVIGFASDFAGAGILFLGTMGSPKWREYLNSISWNPFDNWYAILYVVFATIVSGLLIYILNYKFSFARLEISKRHKRILALALAIFTAPYIFLYPSALANGDSWDQLNFMTNHIVKIDEFRLEVTDNQDNSGKTYIMSRYEYEMKSAINQAEKISGNNAIKFEPDYTLNFYNRDYTVKREMPIQIDGEKGYFEYENVLYAMDEEMIKPFLKAMSDAREIQGKQEFTLTPDPRNSQNSANQAEEINKDGGKQSDYPIFQDSKNKYYIDNDMIDSTVVQFEGREGMDIYSAIESGLVTPQELADHGMKFIVEPRE